MVAPVKLLPHYKRLFDSKDRYFLLTSGRGAGKSFHVADFLLKLTYEVGHTILYTRYTMVSANVSIIPEFTQRIEQYGLTHVFHVTRNEIINTLTRSNILFKGLKVSSGNNTAALKSIANVTTFVLEEGEDLHDEDMFNTIDLSVRHKDLQNRVIIIMNPCFKTHWTYKRFFEQSNLQPTFNGSKDGTTYIHTSYLDNAHNLSQSFLDQAERTRQTNPARYAHQFMGEWLESAEGLLWNQALIDAHRVKVAPPLRRIVVAIDPAITHNASSDETGLVVVGSDKDGQLYVLEDNSGIYTPDQWGQVAKAMADRHNADAYIAEGNQGHDLVAANLQRIDRQRRVKMVRATRGKFVRAEPVYGAYERGEVHHVGYLPKLEQQMTTWNPTESKDSPDRVDALVWGVTELMQSGSQEFFIA